IITGIIGGVCTLVPTALGAVLVYRRALRVELRKNEQDTEVKLIDRWKEYSAELAKVKTEQAAEIAELRAANKELRDQLEAAEDKLERTEDKLADAERRIEGISLIVASQTAQLERLERRLAGMEA